MVVAWSQTLATEMQSKRWLHEQIWGKSTGVGHGLELRGEEEEVIKDDDHW